MFTFECAESNSHRNARNGRGAKKLLYVHATPIIATNTTNVTAALTFMDLQNLCPDPTISYPTNPPLIPYPTNPRTLLPVLLQQFMYLTHSYFQLLFCLGCNKYKN